MSIIYWKFSKNFQKISKNKVNSLSTDEVYGDILKGRSDENFPYKPSSPMPLVKPHQTTWYTLMLEHTIFQLITNCSNNYGPKQHPEKLIPKLIYNIINNKNFPIYGNGKNSREWIYVKDHCEALIKVSKKGKIGEFYNIGSNNNLITIQICRLIKNH